MSFEIPDEQIEVKVKGKTYTYYRFRVFAPGDEVLFEWCCLPIDAEKLKMLIELHLDAFEKGRCVGRSQKAYEIKEVLEIQNPYYDGPIS
jgi:hypothetical protein